MTTLPPKITNMMMLLMMVNYTVECNLLVICFNN